MPLSLIILLAALLLGLPVGGLAQPGAILEPTERVTTGLSIRAEPHADADIVGRILPGERVTQLGAVPYWYQVRLPPTLSPPHRFSWLTWVSATRRPTSLDATLSIVWAREWSWRRRTPSP